MGANAINTTNVQQLFFLKLIKKDQTEIIINPVLVGAMMDKEDYISLFIYGEWIDIDITLDSYFERLNNLGDGKL